MDRDGIKSGYDLPLTRAVADAVPVPVIASGGVGKVEDLVDGVTEGHASAVLAASIFHFGEVSIAQAKAALGSNAGLPIRPVRPDCSARDCARGRADLRASVAAHGRSPRRRSIPWSAAAWARPSRSRRAPAHVAAPCARKRPSAPPCRIAWPRSPPMPPPCAAGRSVEGLHQLRVGFRRLEVALGAFGQEFEQDWLEELRGRAKILSGRLAPARDLDVFVGKLLDRAAESRRSRRCCASCAPAPRARATPPGNRRRRLRRRRGFRAVSG